MLTGGLKQVAKEEFCEEHNSEYGENKDQIVGFRET